MLFFFFCLLEDSIFFIYFVYYFRFLFPIRVSYLSIIRVLRVFVERLVLQFVHFTITLCNFSLMPLTCCSFLSCFFCCFFYAFMVLCFPFSLSCWFSINERVNSSMEVKVLPIGDCCCCWFIFVGGTPSTLSWLSGDP